MWSSYRANGLGQRSRFWQAPDKGELEELVQLISQRVGRCLERQGLLKQDTESAWLDLDPAEDTDAMPQILGSSVSSIRRINGMARVNCQLWLGWKVLHSGEKSTNLLEIVLVSVSRELIFVHS